MAIETLKQNEYTSVSNVYVSCVRSICIYVLLYELFTVDDTPYPIVQPSDTIEHLEYEKRLLKYASLCSPEMYVCFV